MSKADYIETTNAHVFINGVDRRYTVTAHMSFDMFAEPFSPAAGESLQHAADSLAAAMADTLDTNLRPMMELGGARDFEVEVEAEAADLEDEVDDLLPPFVDYTPGDRVRVCYPAWTVEEGPEGGGVYFDSEVEGVVLETGVDIYSREEGGNIMVLADDGLEQGVAPECLTLISQG